MNTKDYIAFISNGKELSISAAQEIVDLETHDQVIQSDECTCTYREHISECEIENVVVSVEDSKNKVKKYVVEMAFCKECGAYYIPQKSYAFLSKKGMITHHVKGGIRLFEYMRFGEAYEEEKVQLEKIEKELHREYDNLPKPVSKYAVADSPEERMNLQLEKMAAQHIYEMRETIAKMMAEPYIGRLDLSDKGKGKATYYIGREDKKIGGVSVHSRWSDWGRLYGRSSEDTGLVNGNVKQVDLRRQIDIMDGQLRGIEDIFSSNTEYAEQGIYDKFLIQVLMSRKKSHQLTDIISTIQDKQNEIIEKALVANIIVQGCAGSGKTMVMLHRLSYWLYNNKSLNPEKIKILTPNENFNAHIGGLHSQLKLGAIEIMSIDQYYKMLLQRYNKDIADIKKVADEENVEERFLNYIYSMQFIKKFKKAYSELVKDLAFVEEVEFLRHCADQCKIRFGIVAKSSKGDSIVEMARVIHEIINKNSSASDNRERLQEKIDKQRDIYAENVRRRKQALVQVAEYKKNYKEKLLEIIENAINFVRESMLGLEESRRELEQSIQSMNKGFLRLISGANRKKEEEKIEKIDKKIGEERGKLETLSTLKIELSFTENIDSALELINSKKTLKEDTLIAEYIGGYIKAKHAVAEQEALMEKSLQEQEEVKQSLEKMELLLPINEFDRVKELETKYPISIVLNIFNSAFNSAISEKLLEFDMQRPEKIYRYELYARVLFAELFWNKTVGDDELICIDEGQDVSYYEYERIIEQNGKHTTFYNVYGDLNQRIKQGRGLKTWEQLEKTLLAHEYELNENYRNTNQITQYCNDVFNFEMTLTGVDGEPVRNILFDEMLSELVEISNSADRIAIILPRTMSKQRVTRAKKVESIKDRISTKFDVTKISVMYVDEIKGIEFDRVYVIDQDMQRNERYIAFTRALDKLTIVH